MDTRTDDASIAPQFVVKAPSNEYSPTVAVKRPELVMSEDANK